MRHPPDPPSPKLALAVPFLSAGAAALTAFALGSDLSEAVFAASMSGACPAFALAAVTYARRRPLGPKGMHLVAASLASLLLLACYVYGRLAGYPTTEIRAALAVVLLAIMLAALASAALDLARVSRTSPRHGRS